MSNKKRQGHIFVALPREREFHDLAQLVIQSFHSGEKDPGESSILPSQFVCARSRR